MSSRPVHLVIDARPRAPGGLLAAEVIQGKSVLCHLLDLAGELTSPSAPVVVSTRAEDQGRLSELVGDSRPGPVIFMQESPRADSSVLRADRVYHPERLRRTLRRGRSPEAAVLWRLDGPASLQAADIELARRLTYQPLGKYWAFPLAEKLTEALRFTPVRPNVVTLAATLLMLSAAGLITAGAAGWAGRFSVAGSLALALVLDTADGRLARLQGTSSALGRWLDQICDELADMVLHAAIAWAAFLRDGWPLWLGLGIIYAAGKHLFWAQSNLGDELEASASRVEPGADGRCLTPASIGPLRPGFAWLSTAVRMAGHADLRWHLWIALALVGRLEIALVLYAVYYPARALAGALRKVVRYA
jgi:phosphatidylglycerophosphate synthase